MIDWKCLLLEKSIFIFYIMLESKIPLPILVVD